LPYFVYEIRPRKSHDAVIRVCDEAGKVIEAHEQVRRVQRVVSVTRNTKAATQRRVAADCKMPLSVRALLLLGVASSSRRGLLTSESPGFSQRPDLHAIARLDVYELLRHAGIFSATAPLILPSSRRFARTNPTKLR
jgi:hypothetical protein